MLTKWAEGCYTRSEKILKKRRVGFNLMKVSRNRQEVETPSGSGILQLNLNVFASPVQPTQLMSGYLPDLFRIILDGTVG